jgi:ATP-binding cassette, subfamily B (MDR/TAP), member 1
MKLLFAIGIIAAILNGLVYPILAYLSSTGFSDLSGASGGDEGLKKVRELSYKFLVVGAYALACGLMQTWMFELVAYNASKRFRLEWFKALLRQDPSFFDAHDIGGISGQVGVSATKYRRGLGRKFGEGIQFSTAGVGGIAYGLYASWRVALVVLAIVPFLSAAALSLMQINQTKSSRAAASYKNASGIAYSAVSSIKTVLSLNGIQEVIYRYVDATQEAYNSAVGFLIRQGIANGKSAPRVASKNLLCNKLSVNFCGQARCLVRFCFFI